MKTAQYILDNACLGGSDINEGVINAMIEFAQLHVQEALKEAGKAAEIAAKQYLRVSDDEDYNTDLVLNSYSLESIK
jgi:predicted nuclease of restriction endonuclease-like (RecB) superfamily